MAEYEDYLIHLVEAPGLLEAKGMTALSGLDPEQVDLLRPTWPRIPIERRQELAQRLVELSEESSDLEFESVFRIGITDEDSDVRAHAVRGLWECEERAIIEPVSKLLTTDDDEDVRASAAQLLGQFALRAELGKLLPIDADRVISALLHAVNDPEETVEVRRRVVEALGPVSLIEVHDIIRESYGDEDERIQASALLAMGLSGDEQWLTIILDEMSNPSPFMRYEAARAAAQLATEEAVPDIITLLDDPDGEVQWMAVTALGAIGGPQATEALQRSLSHPEGLVREAATDALEQIQTLRDPLTLMGGDDLLNEADYKFGDDDDDY